MSLKYGCITPHPKGREYPVDASQYFAWLGGAFVYLDSSSGLLKLALTATATLFGYALAPTNKGAATSGSYWLSSATAGVDRLFVVTDLNAEFIVPNGGSVTTVDDTYNGDGCDLVGVNDGTVQYANVGTSSTKVLTVVGGAQLRYGSQFAASDVIVRLNPAKIEAN